MFKKATNILLALVVALTGLSAATQPVQAANCTQYHIVEGGETLATIARLYGQNWVDIAEYNNLENPNLIFRGQALCVEAPDLGSVQAPSQRQLPKPEFTNQNSNLMTANTTFQREIDLYLGNGGIYMPSSSYQGVVELRRMNRGFSGPASDYRFVQRLLDFQIVDAAGRTFPLVYGINYVYFNLNRQQRLAWDEGALAIFHYDDSLRRWTECPTTHFIASKNEPNGRLACVAAGFGAFGLAVER